MAHNHSHAHGASHAHSHAPADFGRAFALGIAANLAYVALEGGWGLYSGSLALIADAGHNLGDVLGLGLAWGASVLARRQPTPKRTYGLRRGSILAALGNALLLLVAVGGIAAEAIERLRHPAPVAGGPIVAVAAVGIAVNVGTALLFLRGRRDDLNVRGAFLHMVADAAVSLGVVVAGIAIWRTGIDWIDPAVSLVVAAVILAGTWGLLRESLDLALDAVPPGIELSSIRAFLGALPGVCAVHDLHVWPMSTTEVALTAHLVIPGPRPADSFYDRAARGLHDRFGIEHTTLQIECGDDDSPCRHEPDEVL